MILQSFQSFGGLVSNVAFPIVAFYLIYKMLNEELKAMNRNIENLNNSVQHLQVTIQADVLTRADESLKWKREEIERWLEEKGVNVEDDEEYQ